MSHAAAGHRQLRTGRVSATSRSTVALAAFLLAFLVLISVIAWQRSRTSGDSRPYLRDVGRAPQAAQPLIDSIARRNDEQCYDRVLGTTQGAARVTPDSIKNVDYVQVSQVSPDARTVLLTVVCVFGATDRLTLGASGWVEAGPEQIASAAAPS
jgi:hypothetical protein